MGEEGFSSDSSLLYHRGVPSRDRRQPGVGPARPVRHREPPAEAAAPQAARAVRAGVRARRRGRRAAGWCWATATSGSPTSSPDTTSPYYRNAVGDECVYVEAGTGTVETVFGVLSYRTGDYVVVPRATDAPLGARPSRARLYAIEANSHVAPPSRYLSTLRPAARARAVLRARPARPDRAVPGRRHRRRGAREAPRRGPSGLVGSRMTYATHPFDVVGWDGCLYPYTFNVEDFMPITGKVHQPPPVHQVFEGRQLRDLQLRAAQGRLPPASRSRCPTTTRTWTPTR